MTLQEFLLWELCGHLWKIAEKDSLSGFASKEEYYKDLRERFNKIEIGDKTCQEKQQKPKPQGPEKYKVQRKGNRVKK